MKLISRDEMLKLTASAVFCTYDAKTNAMSPLAIRRDNVTFEGGEKDFWYQPIGKPHVDLTFGGMADASFDTDRLERDCVDGSEHRQYYIVNSDELDGLISNLHTAAQNCRFNFGRPRVTPPAMHIDDWLDRSPIFFDADNKILNYVHFFFMYKRFAAVYQMAYKPFMAQYRLFVTYEGKRYQVTGASRMGDIWLSSDFGPDATYDKDGKGRVEFDLAKLSQWSRYPEIPGEPVFVNGITDEEISALMGKDLP